MLPKPRLAINMLNDMICISKIQRFTLPEA